ncbi:DUF742 domain-containing protein [Nocardia sp. NPDC055029]
MKDDEADRWFDDDPGPLVRPFAVTRGRAGRNVHDLDLITLVVAIRPLVETTTMDREYEEILRMCDGSPVSIAEISAHLKLMLAAVKVLVSDLISSGHLLHQSPPQSLGRDNIQLLQAVLEGVRNA